MMNKMMDMVCKEYDQLAEKGTLTSSNLDTAYKLILMKEKLLRIEELEGKLGYSQDGGWIARGNYSRNGYPMEAYGMRENSYGMDPYYDQSMKRGRYSMEEGRSMMGDRLTEMLNDPNLSQQERAALRKAMENMRS